MAGKKEYLKLDKEDVKRRFDEYNRLYFGNKLSEVTFSLTEPQGCYGSYTPYDNKKCVIKLCRGVYWTDEALKCTIIHEMIHHYVHTISKPSWWWEPPHGLFYHIELWKLRWKYGLKVGVHNSPNPYFKNEIVPTTFLGRLSRRFLGASIKE